MKTILVVDDCDAWRKLSTDLLSEAGYHVVEVESGLKALELVQTVVPDLVLIDLSMLPLDGLKTARQLRGLDGCERVPIILFTTIKLPGDYNHTPVPHVTGYLSKYDAPDLLVSCVEKHLQKADAAENVQRAAN